MIARGLKLLSEWKNGSPLRAYNASDNNVVILCDDKSFGVKQAAKVIALDKKKKSECNFVIVSQGHSSQTIEMLQKHRGNAWFSFVTSDLVRCFDMDHVLVPDVKVLSDSEVKSIEEQYKCPADKFSAISSADPLSQYLNLKIGCVIELSFYSANIGKRNEYRKVIPEDKAI